jgi:hypothetical protein
MGAIRRSKLRPDGGSSSASAAKAKLTVTSQHRAEATAYSTTNSGARINHGRSILFVERYSSFGSILFPTSGEAHRH